MRDLPQELRFEWGGVSLLMVHANPWHDDSVHITPYRPKQLFLFIEEEADADVVVLGHSHTPFNVCCRSTTIVNPGSVWQNRNLEVPTVGVLDLVTRAFRLYNVDSGKQVPLPRIEHECALVATRDRGEVGHQLVEGLVPAPVCAVGVAWQPGMRHRHFGATTEVF